MWRSPPGPPSSRSSSGGASRSRPPGPPPRAPFSPALGFARYLTRGTSRAYRALARTLRPFLGELDALVDKNLARAPRRSANTAMIATFVVGVGLAMWG